MDVSMSDLQLGIHTSEIPLFSEAGPTVQITVTNEEGKTAHLVLTLGKNDKGQVLAHLQLPAEQFGQIVPVPLVFA